MALDSVVFFGSGPVAARSLELLSGHCDIEAVITKPSTLKEMQKVAGSAVVYTVSTKTELDTLITEQKFSSKLGVLIDFGIIVSQDVIDYFPLGIINSHFSLLPQWRGADPITFSLLSGQPETGVSLMLLTAGMDEGPILTLSNYVIGADETNPHLTEGLIDLSDSLLKDCIPKYMANELVARPQDEVAELIGISPVPTYSRKLTKADGQIDWTKPADVIEREIRAYYSWPKSFAKLGAHDVIIRKARVIEESGKPSSIKADKQSLIVYCGENALSVEVIQPAGKKEMPIQAFLNGYSITTD